MICPEGRDALVASDPETFLMPPSSDLRFKWVMVRLDWIDLDQMREFVSIAWRLVMTKFVFRTTPTAECRKSC